MPYAFFTCNLSLVPCTLRNQLHPIAIQLQEYEQQHCEAPERRAAVTEERQRDADDGHQTDGHSDVDHNVEEENRRHAVAVNSAELRFLPFGQHKQADEQRQEEKQQHGGAHKAPFLANGAKNEVGALFGHEFEFCLRALQIALASESARPDGNHRLVDVVARALQIDLNAKQMVDAGALVRRQNVIEEISDRKGKPD